MNDRKEQLLNEEYRLNEKTVVIQSKEELMSFIIDILEIGDNMDSEEQLYNDRSYRILFDLLNKMGRISIAIEEKYVDKTYRDSYYIYFSCKHEEYSRFCKRIFIFLGDVFEESKTDKFSELDVEKLQKRFIGVVVIRPLRDGKIGRSLINPYFVLDPHNTYLRYAKYSVTIYGMRLQINAFPYSMQDGETTRCAEITILNLMDYFSRKYSEYKIILPSEIVQIAGEKGFERVLPSQGLKYPVISRIFSEAGFCPRIYEKNELTDTSLFKRIMHYYVESGIPIAVGMNVDEKCKHSIICIGHGKINYGEIGKKIYAVYDATNGNHVWIIDSADLCSDYIVMDDGRIPYENLEWKLKKQKKESETFELKQKKEYLLGDYEPEVLMVPLYKRMFLEAQDAYDICTLALASKIVGIQRFYSEKGTRSNPMIIRLFMCSSRNYKHQRISNLQKENGEIGEIYKELRLPRFIWVCEVYDENGYKEGNASGEIVIDATAAPYDGIKNVVLFHYPYYIWACNKNIENLYDKNEGFRQLHQWKEFKGYDHNLFPPEKIVKNIKKNNLKEG